MFHAKVDFENHCKRLAGGDVSGIVLGKYQFSFDTEDVSLTPHLREDGFWEAWVSFFMYQIIEPKWKCVDIGANVGYYTILMADAGAYVTAFEPLQRAFSLLSLNVVSSKHSRRVKLINAAVSDKDGDANFFVPKKNHGSASLYENLMEWPYEKHTVRTVKPEHDIDYPVNLIKIDAEGSEPTIFKNLDHSQIDSLIIEWSPSRHGQEFLDIIRAAGYRICIIEETGNVYGVNDELLMSLELAMIYLSK